MGEMLELVNTVVRYAIEMFVKSEYTHMQDVISGLERVSDHATNIAFAIMDQEKANEG